MPAVLTDPPAALWVLLLMFALVSAGLWVRSRNRTAGLLAVIAVVVMVLLFLCRFAGESPRQEAIRRVKALVAAIDARKPDDMLAHVADDFDYKGRKKKDIPASPLWELLRIYNARASAGGVGQDFEQPDDTTAVIGFTGWATVDGKDYPMYVRAFFKKDAKGEWKVQTFKAYSDPIRKANGPEADIPGLSGGRF